MLLAIDLGTNALKVGLFDSDGRVRAWVRRSYAVRAVGANGGEQSPDDWWTTLCQVLGAMLAEHTPPPITAICVIGQGPSLVVCDAGLRPRGPALIWADQRDHAERARLSAQFGYEVSSYSLLPKVSWLARSQPVLFQPRATVLQAYDFIAARLAGRPFAAQFGAWPPFSAAEFAQAGLDPAWIPPIAPMGEPIGVTSAPWCVAAHLPVGIPIMAGVYDSVATTLGVGLCVVGRACDFGGVSGGYGLCWNAPLTGNGIAAWPGARADQWLVGGATAGAGATIDWFARTFGGAEHLAETLLQAAAVSAGADGLVCLPYLAGERAPIWDDAVRGAFVGLALHHRRPHLARAVLEGIAFGLRHIADVVAQSGGRLNELRVCGGTAHYELLNQIKADVFGVPVVVPHTIEASLLGAAMIGAVGCGLQPDFATASHTMAHVARQLEPDTARHTAYAEVYAKFLRLTAMRLR